MPRRSQSTDRSAAPVDRHSTRLATQPKVDMPEVPTQRTSPRPPKKTSPGKTRGCPRAQPTAAPAKKTTGRGRKRKAEEAPEEEPETKSIFPSAGIPITMETDQSQHAEGATKPSKCRDDTPSTSGQPSRQQWGSNDIIIKVSQAISEDGDLWRLGPQLGVDNADIKRAVATNWATGVKTSNGNLMMLQSWAETVKQSQQLPTLRAALEKAGLVEVAETCLPSSNAADPKRMPDEILKLKDKLKARYKKFSEVKTSPVDSTSRKWLQHIYVSLVLMLGLKKEEEEPIDYNGLFKRITTETPKGFETRFVFLGEAGVGKSTLFAKIALDWAEGKVLQEIDLLFLESFREIEERKYFGDIVMNHFPDDMDTEGERVDKYIRENPRNVLVLLDGLDEAKMDIRRPNRNDAVLSMIRGERFIDTPVLITTRPFGADQIKGIMKVNDQYMYIKIKGFTKENMRKYISNFFEDDVLSALSLIHFVDTNNVVSKHMAPFPIFCCMLCYMWKKPSERENIQKMRTFSQLLKRLVFSLQEHYSCKHSECGYEMCMKEADECITQIGSVAFHGLLVKQLIFDEEAMGSCINAATTACEVGILSEEMRLAPLKIRERQRKQFIQEFAFPHKLLQEYTASFYLASLYTFNRLEFNRILTDKLVVHYREFRYVLYFTAAHGGEVGLSVMEALCKKVKNINFIVEVAFECHDTEAIDPVRNLLKMETELSFQNYSPITAYLFTLETLGKEVVRKCSSVDETSGPSKFTDSSPSSYVAAVGLLTLQNLRLLDIGIGLDDDFYTGICAAASQSKIETLEQRGADLGPSASSHYARGLFSMPNLQSLKLSAVKLSDEFYSTMASEASKSKIEKLTCDVGDLGPSASSHYARGLFSMPNLQSLDMCSVKLSDEFYSTMASEASKSKIETLEQGKADLGPAASSHYARGLFAMPNLQSLKMWDVKLSDEFYSTMASEASKSKIQSLSMSNVAMTRRRLHTILSLPCLQSLSLKGVGPIDMDDGETTSLITSVDELEADGKDVTGLWKLGLHSSCPRVQKFELHFEEELVVSSDIITKACSPFQHLTHLHIKGEYRGTTLGDPMSFCKAVITSCPQLTKLSITGIELYNKKATEIIQSMKTHPHLTMMALHNYDTNKDLDPLIAEVNSEGKLTITVEHGGVNLESDVDWP